MTRFFSSTVMIFVQLHSSFFTCISVFLTSPKEGNRYHHPGFNCLMWQMENSFCYTADRHTTSCSTLLSLVSFSKNKNRWSHPEYEWDKILIIQNIFLLDWRHDYQIVDAKYRYRKRCFYSFVEEEKIPQMLMNNFETDKRNKKELLKPNWWKSVNAFDWL